MEEEGYEPPPKVKVYIEDRDHALKEMQMKRHEVFLADINQRRS